MKFQIAAMEMHQKAFFTKKGFVSNHSMLRMTGAGLLVRSYGGHKHRICIKR
jgi:hypothetical protein